MADIIEVKSENDRTVMHLLYGAHAVGPFTVFLLALIALVVNYIRRGDEADPLYRAHHGYMIRTFWWAALWLLLSLPLWLLVLPGYVAWTVVGIWYLYRCIRGWLRFNDNREP